MTGWVILATGALVGLLIGSFLNVVIHRGPAMWRLIDESRGDLIAPRSYCPACQKPIRTIHLFPVIGFLLLGGKCASCGAPISARYPFVELLGALAAVVAVILFGFSVEALLAAAFFWLLIPLAFIDAETGYLPDALTLPLVALGLITNGFGLFAAWPHSLIGALAGYLAFRLVAEAFRRLRRVEGLGQGDAKLLGGIGAWLGWPALAPVVFAGAVLALLAVGLTRVSGRRIASDAPIPFGPALAAAGALAMIARGLDLPAYYWG